MKNGKYKFVCRLTFAPLPVATSLHGLDSNGPNEIRPPSLFGLKRGRTQLGKTFFALKTHTKTHAHKKEEREEAKGLKRRAGGLAPMYATKKTFFSKKTWKTYFLVRNAHQDARRSEIKGEFWGDIRNRS